MPKVIQNTEKVAKQEEKQLQDAGMATVAEQLRTAREARNLTVEQVADILKMRTDHVRALEEGNYDVFSAPVYIRGFVRTYATLLKMELPKVMATLDEELGQTRNFAEPPPLTDQSRGALDFVMLVLSQLSWRKAAIGLGVVAGIALVVWGVSSWQKSRASDPLSEVKPGMYQSTQGVSGDVLPLPAPAPARR